jgi:hypothetical protein
MPVIPLTQDVSTRVLTPVQAVTKRFGLSPTAGQPVQIVRAQKLPTTPRGFNIAFETWAHFFPDRCATRTAEDTAEMAGQFREMGFDTPWYLHAVLASTQRNTTPSHTVALPARHKREMAKILKKAAPSSVVPADLAKGGLHALLTDVIANTKQVFDYVVVTDGTVISSQDHCAHVFLKGTIKQPVAELKISTLFVNRFKELAPLLKTSDHVGTELKVLRGRRDDDANMSKVDYSSDLLVGQNRFETTAPRQAPEQATINDIPWDAHCVDHSKANTFYFLRNSFVGAFKVSIAATGQLAFTNRTGTVSMDYAEVNDPSTTPVMYALSAPSVHPGDLFFDTDAFNRIMQIVGKRPMTLSLTQKGVMGFHFETDVADYRLYLRGRRP